MHLILLGGNNAKNKALIESIHSHTKDLFDETYIHYYQHWKTGDELIDFETEAKNLASQLPEEQYAIFAKSAGSLLALKMIHEDLLQPKFCVFAGTAILWGRHYNLPVDTWLEEYSIPTTFIQNEQDPTMSFTELDALLKERHVANSRLVQIPNNDTHHYTDLDLIRGALEIFANN